MRVEPKAMRVLTLLASKAGQVVTRQELEDVVWENMVVGPDALTNTVIKLRHALGDDAKNARIIETIPKTGYRLIALVREAEEGEIESPLERRLSAILYADVAGYSRLTGEDEERTHRILSANLDLFSEAIRTHNGKVVHYAGDAILAEFATVTEALSCAVEVQRELRERDTAHPNSPSVQFRIGINLGEVIVDRDDIYGDGVNIAARLEGLADTGSICISESVHSAVGNKLPLDYEFMGEQSVKNIAEPVRAYRVLFYPSSQKAGQIPKVQKKVVLIAAVLGAMIIGSVILWQQFSITVGDKIQTSAPTNLDKPTIAVLPFANVSVDVNDEYLADGMTTDLITDLSKISGIYVIARSSVFAYKNQAINVSDIGRELGAQYIVEGSIRKSGGRIRINVQLVDAATSRHLWADRYDRDFDEFFTLQDEVITQVVSAVSVTLTDNESAQIKRPPTTNLQAYDYYLRAQQAGYIGGGTELVDTMSLYTKAISLDPEFAEAHAGLARAAVEAWRSDIIQVMSGAKARILAYESASRALEIDPANGQAYSVLAVLQLADGQHEAAIESGRKAVELGPGSAEAHLDLGLVLAYSGKPKQGVDEIETALRLNPKPTTDTLLYAGIVYFIDGQYQRTVGAHSKALVERQGTEPVWTYLSAAHALLGRKEEAAKIITNLLERFHNVSVEYYRVRYSYFHRPKDLDRLLNGLSEAGLPNWPFDFRGSKSNRLNEQELRNIVEDKTWVGNHSNGTEFFQQISGSGSLAYRSKNSIQTGTASIQGDKLCQQFDSTLNRELCGYVYHNPDGSDKTKDKYIVIMPDSLRHFSLAP
ncbi:MAG: winged helix-turn-helix domain-containing protein [Nitrosomonadaceae bacterium]